MTATASDQLVFGEVSQHHLECSICSNHFREPKVLNCLHTFCLKCIQDLRMHQGPSGAEVLCPICRQETTVGESAAHLPNYFTLSAQVEEATMMEQLLESQGSDSEIKCEACDEENEAISRCMDCITFLCRECKMAHERLAVMKFHKMYTLAQLRSGEIVYKSKLRDHVPKCGKHPDQNLSIYCNTCEELVCTTCSVLDHGNPTHSLIGLPEALEKCKQDVAELAAKAEDKGTELNTVISITDKCHKKLDTMFTDTNTKISKRADEEVVRIREEEQKLKYLAEEIYKDRVQTFKTAQASNSKEVIQAKHKLDEVNQLMAQANTYEILDLRQKVLENIKQLTRKQPQKVPERLSFMEFEKGDERSLGRLLLEDEVKVKSVDAAAEGLPRPGRWEMMTEIKTYGHEQKAFKGVYDVAVFSNSEIILADTKRRQLLSFLPQSHPPSRSNAIPERLQITGLTNPSRIAVNRVDQLIVLDGPAVKTFNREYQLLHQFVPGRGPNSMPACLAVNDSNQIAVGYHLKGVASLHNPDGSLIKTVAAPLIDYYLSIYEQQLIYTNIRQKKLLSVNYDGGKVYKVDINSSVRSHWHPVSVCCDRDGSIYVAGCEGILKSSGEVHRFSPDGHYTGCIIKGCGSPCGITFAPNGELIVAGGRSVKIYRCHHV